jgi:hypothetical protein
MSDAASAKHTPTPKPIESLDKQIDDIVAVAYLGEISWTHDQLDGTSYLQESLETIESQKAETKNAIRALITERERKARIEERELALMYLHGTNRKQDYLNRLTSLSTQEGDK